MPSLKFSVDPLYTFSGLKQIGCPVHAALGSGRVMAEEPLARMLALVPRFLQIPGFNCRNSEGVCDPGL